ncbi:MULTISPECIES: hypothetical protein [Noviherbaspirillum]|uniref:hypothetical protein n=1 Tax=Noviherbaspirillum TaxID=1344552 RepID=UPI00124DAF32|nr:MULTISPECIES: hypothetical protein [Noviherbaspirillum]
METENKPFAEWTDAERQQRLDDLHALYGPEHPAVIYASSTSVRIDVKNRADFDVIPRPKYPAARGWMKTVADYTPVRHEPYMVVFKYEVTDPAELAEIEVLLATQRAERQRMSYEADQLRSSICKSKSEDK